METDVLSERLTRFEFRTRFAQVLRLAVVSGWFRESKELEKR